MNQTETLKDTSSEPEDLHGFTRISAMNRSSRFLLLIIISLVLLIIGAAALVESVILDSRPLAFIGLGLTFWGIFFIFVRPTRYARVELLGSTTLPSVQAIDRIVYDMGFYGHGVYVPKRGSEWVALFVPSDKDFSGAPSELDEDSTIQSNPKGVVFVPPGLELAKIFLQKLKAGNKKVTLDRLTQELPHLLTSDLEIMKRFEIDVKGDYVTTRSTDSIYSDFCEQVKFKTRVCAEFGCPICSAVACLLVYATGRPVRLESDMTPAGPHVSQSNYYILPAEPSHTKRSG